MVISEVSISNMALTRIGQQRISSMTQQGLEAQLCDQYYESTLRELLSAYEWPFAIKRASLSLVTGDNFTKYEYKYLKPSDLLRPILLLDSDSFEDSEAEWFTEGQFFYTDYNPAYLKYVAYIDNPNDLPQSFIEAFYLRLATKIALKMTQDQGLMGMLYQEYMAAMQSAMGIIGGNSKQLYPAETLWSS